MSLLCLVCDTLCANSSPTVNIVRVSKRNSPTREVKATSTGGVLAKIERAQSKQFYPDTHRHGGRAAGLVATGDAGNFGDSHVCQLGNGHAVLVAANLATAVAEAEAVAVFPVNNVEVPVRDDHEFGLGCICDGKGGGRAKEENAVLRLICGFRFGKTGADGRGLAEA